jgi:hypothetical protein
MNDPIKDWEDHLAARKSMFDQVKVYALETYGGIVMGYESIDDVLTKPPRGHTREMVMDNVFRMYLMLTMPPRPIVIEKGKLKPLS